MIGADQAELALDASVGGARAGEGKIDAPATAVALRFKKSLRSLRNSVTTHSLLVDARNAVGLSRGERLSTSPRRRRTCSVPRRSLIAVALTAAAAGCGGAGSRSADSLRNCVGDHLPPGAVDRVASSTVEGVTTITYVHRGSETSVSIFASEADAKHAELAEARLGMRTTDAWVTCSTAAAVRSKRRSRRASSPPVVVSLRCRCSSSIGTALGAGGSIPLALGLAFLAGSTLGRQRAVLSPGSACPTRG